MSQVICFIIPILFVLMIAQVSSILIALERSAQLDMDDNKSYFDEITHLTWIQSFLMRTWFFNAQVICN